MRTILNKTRRAIVTVAISLSCPILLSAQMSANKFLFLQGSGTYYDPYLIDSFDALVEFREKVALESSESHVFAKITADIDMSDDPNWAPIGQNGSRYVADNNIGNWYYCGEVDGMNHTISNLKVNKYIDATNDDVVYFGLFGRVNGKASSSIMNLTLKDVDIKVTLDANAAKKDVNVGSLAGTAGCMLTNVHVNGTINVEDKADEDMAYKEVNVGGVVGTALREYTGTLYNKYASQLADLHADINISSSALGSSIGGIVGFCNDADIETCTTSGVLTGRNVIPTSTNWDIQIGGICGNATTNYSIDFNEIASICQMSGGFRAGGLIGYVSTGASMSLNNSYAAGSLLNTYKWAGGLIGAVVGTATNVNCYLDNCYYAGTVAAKSTATRAALVGTCHPNGNGIHYVFRNSFFDKKMTNDTSDYFPLLTYHTSTGAIDETVTREDIYKYVMGYDTEDIIIKEPRFAILADEEKWVFQNGFYPRLQSIKETSVAQLAAVPVFFSVGDNAERVYENVTLPQASCNATTATWTAPVGKGIINNQSAPARLMSQEVGYETLTLTAGNTAKRLDLYMAYSDVVWEGESHIPTGDKQTVFAKGNGTSANPYIIMNAGQLAYALKNNTQNEYYKFGHDIIINNNLLRSPEDGTPWIDTKKATYSWNAILEGNGFVVCGLYMPKQSSTNHGHQHGLLGRITSTAMVRDMGVVEALITDDLTQVAEDTYVGVIAGSVESGAQIDNCLTTGAILLEGQGGHVYAGGVCGQVSGTISNCLNAASVMSLTRDVMTQNNQLGGIAAKASGATLTNCVNIGRVSHYSSNTNPSYGGICPGNGFMATNCYYDLQATACSNGNDASGIEALTTSQLTDGTRMSGQDRWTVAKGCYPVLNFAANNISSNATVLKAYQGMISLPMTIKEGENAASLRNIMSLPLRNVRWQTTEGSNYINAFMDYGLIEPAAKGTAELLCACQLKNGGYIYNKKYITVNQDFHRGIQFVDPKAEQACVEAFGSDGAITLSQAASVTDFTDFINHTATDEIVRFPELRYFIGLDRLTDELTSCQMLQEVELPLSLSSIARDAFAQCDALQSVTMPANLTQVEPYAFRGSQLKEIQVSTDNSNFVSHDGVLFDKDRYIVAYPPMREGESYIYTDSINGILEGAFIGIDQLRELYIGDDEGNCIDLRANAIPVEMQVFVNDATDGMDYLGMYLSEQERDWISLYSENHLQRYFPLKVTSALLATMCIYFDTHLPEGMTAYYCYEEDDDEGKLRFNSIGCLVPAGLPVLIKSNKAGTFPLLAYEDGIEEMPETPLARFQGSGPHGFIVGDQSDESGTNMGSILTLGHNSHGQIGFFYYSNSSNKISPYKAYFAYETLDGSAGAKSFSIAFDNLTSITRYENDQEPNGNATIYPDDTAVYDLTGRKVAKGATGKNSLPRGIYIYKGRRIVIK